mmetsp:Transcript_5014/g.14463  ORF Transcript_5014/g.14463 Transcript_5014/m.14463 type:complete len:475 (-) Transcript_5014:223-1647(-)
MCVDFGTCFALDTLPALHELLDEHLQLLDADIRHDDDVCDVALARELPLPDECLLLGPLEHDRRAELIEHRLDAGSLEHFHEAVRVRQAELDILLNARVPLHCQGVPQVDWRVTVPGPHDRRIPAVQVLDVAADTLDQVKSRHHDAARHGRADKLVPRDRHGPDRLLERHLGRLLHERNHHPEQRPIAVNIEIAFVEAALVENRKHFVHIVHGAPHRRPDVHVDDGRAVLVLHQLGPKVPIVHLPAFQCVDLHRIHPIHPRSLEDTVMRLHARVEDPVRQRLPAHQDAVQISLRPAVGHVPPKLVPFDLPQLGEPIQHANLEFARVHPVVGLDERVPQVVDHELLQALQRPVVKVEIIWIPHVRRRSRRQLVLVRVDDRRHTLPGARVRLANLQRRGQVVRDEPHLDQLLGNAISFLRQYFLRLLLDRRAHRQGLREDRRARRRPGARPPRRRPDQQVPRRGSQQLRRGIEINR